MAINYLYDEYKKDPQRIEKLLDSHVEISEKLNGSRFLVQIDETGTFSFFKRKDMSITKIDRTLSQYYENAIDHFDNMNDEQKLLIKQGWRFGMEYFPSIQSSGCENERIPLNNLVLTDIQVKDPNDKTIDIITDKKTLDDWADILEVEKPPIVFDGKISTEQKNKILDFLNTTNDFLLKKFKTDNFGEYLLDVLGSDMKSVFSCDPETNISDGLIFKFDGKETMKTTGSESHEKNVGNFQKKPSDIYNLTLVIIHEFLIGLNLKKIKLVEKTFEDRYIEFISKVFNLFLKTKEYEKNYKNGIDFDLPEFLSKEDMKSNFSFVKNPETKELLNKSNTNRELFKIMMASMRSHKKKPSGYFSKELIYHHNVLVDKIMDYVNTGNGSISEDSMCSFDEYKKIFLNESDEYDEYDDEAFIKETNSLDEKSKKDFKSLVPNKKIFIPEFESTLKKPMDVIGKMIGKKSFSPEEERKGSPVCLMMGSFFPYNNAHETIIKDANKASEEKIFIVVMTKKTEGVINKEIVSSMMTDVMDGNECVCGWSLCDGKSFSDAVSTIPKKFFVDSFAGDEEDCDDVDVQTTKKIKTYPMTRHISSSSIIEKIREEKYDEYSKLVPKKLHNYFYKIKTGLKNDETR